MINYGKQCIFIFNVEINPSTAVNQGAQFSLIDSEDNVFTAYAAELQSDRRTFICYFNDFNTAVGLCQATYTPGTLVSMASIAVPFTQFEFLPQNLHPPVTEPPIVAYAYNTKIDGTDVIIVFDKTLTTEDVSSEYQNFSVSFTTKSYAPDGDLQTVTRSPIASEYLDDHSIVLSFGSGNGNSIQNAYVGKNHTQNMASSASGTFTHVEYDAATDAVKLVKDMDTRVGANQYTWTGIHNKTWAQLRDDDTIWGGTSYFSTGTASYSFTITNYMKEISTSSISWTETAPEGTEVIVKTYINGVQEKIVSNGGEAWSRGAKLNQGDTVTIEVTLSTEEDFITPIVSNLRASVTGAEPVLITSRDFPIASSEDGTFTRTVYTEEDDAVQLDKDEVDLVGVAHYTWGELLDDFYWEDIEEGNLIWGGVGFYSTGTVTYLFTLNTDISNVTSSIITWEETLPEGTEIEVAASINGAPEQTIESGDQIIETGTSLWMGDTIVITATLSTEEPFSTPVFAALQGDILGTDAYLAKVNVIYNGAGALAGEAGYVQAFNEPFLPIPMTQKLNQHEAEHIEVTNITATGVLTAIQYLSGYSTEHIEVTSITATGVLTKVGDV